MLTSSVFTCPYTGPQEKPGMSGQKIGNSKEFHATLIPFQPRSVSGSTRTEGMQPVEKETKQRRKMREALMRVILETACLLLAYWHVRCRRNIYPTHIHLSIADSPTAVKTCVTALAWSPMRFVLLSLVEMEVQVLRLCKE